jgi:hypothetical protein
MLIDTCQFIGADQRNYPFKMCGCTPFPGRAYCEEHLWQVYRKGTSVGNRRKIKEIERELAEVKQLEEMDLDD